MTPVSNPEFWGKMRQKRQEIWLVTFAANIYNFKQSTVVRGVGVPANKNLQRYKTKAQTSIIFTFLLLKLFDVIWY